MAEHVTAIQTPNGQTSSGTATALGLGAVVLWGLLAALTAGAGSIPPFQLNALTFAIGTLVGILYGRVRGTPLALAAIPLGAWALGIYGLMAFHAAYFFALQNAPVMEVSLVVYLWPLLIVLFSGLLPARLGGGRLSIWHVSGAMLALSGVALLIAGGRGGPDFSRAGIGIAAALAAAFIWASYSVASRLYRDVPSSAVTGFCGATAVCSFVFHKLLETSVWPNGLGAWLAIIGCGLGPVGLAFYLWDEGMKRGDLRLLGVASYATPLISTLVLAALGIGEATGRIWLAAALVTAGALIASRDTLFASKPHGADPHDRP
jgi:drug/metabolite transporter (DMT)-like permease